MTKFLCRYFGHIQAWTPMYYSWDRTQATFECFCRRCHKHLDAMHIGPTKWQIEMAVLSKNKGESYHG